MNRDLKSRITKELDALNLHDKTNINIRSFNEVYPRADNKERYSIQLSFNSRKHIPSCSYLDFWYDVHNKRIDHIHISLKDDLKGKGYGRSLIQAIEHMGQELSCSISRVNLNTNNSFWSNLGYIQVNDYWEKKL